ncbi:MAG TPA: hydrolase [Chitinivibrionales bacterium]
MDRSLLVTKKGIVLLVVDVQEKFRGAIPRFDEIVGNIVRLILTFQMYDLPIIVTEQYPAGLGHTVEPIRKLFSFLEIVEKMEFSATDNAHFWPQVNALKADTFVVCGLETHICVNQTAVKLVEKGMQVHVVADAVASRNALDHNVALRKMERAGAQIITTEMCMFELTEKAGTENFKNIQRMVRGKLNLNALQKALTEPQTPTSSSAMRQAEEKSIESAEQKKEPFAAAAQALPGQTAETNKQTNGADDVLDMIDTPEQAPAAAPENKTIATAEATSVNAMLEAIDAVEPGSKAASDKSEVDLDKDIKDIDTLLGNLGINESDVK